MNVTQVLSQTEICQSCTIRNRAICADLHADEIVLLNSIGRHRTLTAGEQLLWEGEDAVLVGNVVEGLLKLSTGTSEGREQIVGLAYPGDFVGRPFGGTDPYGVEALAETRMCVFRRQDFDAFAREHPRLEHKLLERTLTELDRTRRWMLLLGRMDAEQKLATFLLDMVERLSGAPGLNPELTGGNTVPAFALPIGRQQIADVLGLTIETVSRHFTRLKKDGILDLPSRREVAILDRAALQDRAG
ncbi:Crp/Fnr family transcriptional regulator [Pontixanthobacter aestiaquae]|uniref:Helix-turn-helix domain-containing protein n=1 Tax=Pontixanthobacter aestiaquae TaxID=1509367 RepID=A0A844Z784_9SPHN|nr:Crp/Fnr family transcriptional regulator [Pontixanthobacter aestiaquae]MDN3647255.1 Crp/Fnr family transcriptional regulator [Pontixanthobacter aestiaquae]MXO81769.1 helix-turn-helix domain-containing protein [Pontixanthobacter aestiaquae]